MNQVFLILVHKQPKQLLMLLQQLESSESHFIIHVDLKSEIQDFKKTTTNINNIHFVNERYDVGWGSISIVKATLALIKELHSNNLNYSHAHLLSGEDILIKPILELNQFFSDKSDKIFMEFFELPCQCWSNGGLDRLTNYYFGNDKKNITYIAKLFNGFSNLFFGRFPFLRKKLIDGINFYGGAAWWSINMDGIDYVNKYVTDNPEFVRFFKFSKLPDEIFFQTILFNSKIKFLIDSNCKRYIDWNSPAKGSPAVLELEDFNDLMQSDMFFARKINFTTSSQLYKMF